MRRISLAILVLVVASCRHDSFDEQSRVARQCPGSGNPPIVCIDAGTGVASPDPIRVKQGQWAHFFFVSGNDELTIDSGVLENKDHQGGHAWGKAMDNAPLGPSKYTIHDKTTGKNWDPTIIIDPHA